MKNRFVFFLLFTFLFSFQKDSIAMVSHGDLQKRRGTIVNEAWHSPFAHLRKTINAISGFNISAPGIYKLDFQWSKLYPLHAFAAYGDYRVVEILLKGYQKEKINTKDDWGRATPLHYLAGVIDNKNDLRIAKLLLENGARDSLSIGSSEGWTPLMYAIYLKNEKLAELILNYSTKKDVNTKEKNNSKKTPLHFAIYDLDKDVFKLMLEHGADPTIKDKWGKTVYDYLQEDTISKIIDREAKIKMIEPYFAS